MLTTTYENVKRNANLSTKGFLKQRALAKLDKQILKGNKTLIYLRNKLSKINFSNPFRERNNYNLNTPLSPFKIDHLCYSTLTSRLKQITNIKLTPPPSKTLFVTEIPSPKITNYKHNFTLHNKLFPTLKEASLYNQIHLIPFQIQKKRPPLNNKKVYFNLETIQKECGIKYNDRSRNCKKENDLKEKDDLYNSDNNLTEMTWEEKWDKGLVSCNSNKNNSHCRNNNDLFYNSYEDGSIRNNDFIHRTLTTYNLKQKSIVNIRKTKTTKHSNRSYNANYLNNNISIYNNKIVHTDSNQVNIVKKEMFSNKIKQNKLKFKSICLLKKHSNNTNTISNTTNITNSRLNTLASHIKSSSRRKHKLNIVYN